MYDVDRPILHGHVNEVMICISFMVRIGFCHWKPLILPFKTLYTQFIGPGRRAPRARAYYAGALVRLVLIY